jgi:hypothetical protein
MPGCGFRIRPGGVIDLECLCSGVLCPIGVADTCDQALSLLDQQQTSLMVCEQANEGRCVQLGPDGGSAETTGASSTSNTAVSSTCDKTCESECAGEPDCIQLCGC